MPFFQQVDHKKCLIFFHNDAHFLSALGYVREALLLSVSLCTLWKCSYVQTDIGNQSDGVTESPLRRSTAPLSTEPHREETAKATRHLLFPEYVIGSGSGSSTHSLSNSIFSIPPTPVTIAQFGLLGSVCYKDKDCSVPYSNCKSSICTCRSGFTQSADRQTCVGK